MTAPEIALEGRTFAESRMTDRCTVRAKAGRAYNEATDGYDLTPGTLRHDGACHVKPRDNADKVVEAGAQTLSLWPFVVSVPMSVTTVQVDDVVEVTQCDLDPALVGVRLRVRQVAMGSQITARRLGCEVQTP